MEFYVDVLFFVDATGSMGYLIDRAKVFMSQSGHAFNTIGADVKYFVVLYRDHPPQDYSFASRVIADCVSNRELNEILRQSSDFRAFGGGDMPESGLDAIAEIENLSVRATSQRYGFIIGDAPLHGTPYGGGRTNITCKCGRTSKDAARILEQFNVSMTGINIRGNESTLKSFASFCEEVTAVYSSQGIDAVIKKLTAYAASTKNAIDVIYPALQKEPFISVFDLHKDLDIPVADIRTGIEILNAIGATAQFNQQL